MPVPWRSQRWKRRGDRGEKRQRRGEKSFFFSFVPLGGVGIDEGRREEEKKKVAAVVDDLTLNHSSDARPPPPPPFPFPSPNSFSSPEREPAHCSALPLDPHLRQPISDLILSGSQIEAMCTPKPAAAAEATAAGDVERPPKTRLGVGPSGKESSSLGGGSSGVGSTSSLGSRLSSLWSDMFQDAPHEMVRRRQGLAVEEEDEL